MPDAAPNLFDLLPDEFDALVRDGWRWPKFRAGQIRKWAFRKNTLDPAKMTDLPANLRDELPSRLDLSLPTNRPRPTEQRRHAQAFVDLAGPGQRRRR